eukprot:82065-Prymnesium_polylepis.1
MARLLAEPAAQQQSSPPPQAEQPPPRPEAGGTDDGGSSTAPDPDDGCSTAPDPDDAERGEEYYRAPLTPPPTFLPDGPVDYLVSGGGGGVRQLSQRIHVALQNPAAGAPG